MRCNVPASVVKRVEDLAEEREGVGADEFECDADDGEDDEIDWV